LLVGRALADVADRSFASGSFDLVVANHLLNDLPDIAGPVSELARVLRSAGRLMILMLSSVFLRAPPSDGDPPADG
jgi:ubiquinone/menaquinone biosynthesis C-methylase UbiE